MPPGAPSGRRRTAAAIYWASAVVVLLLGLGTPSLRGSEDRFAEIAREMILLGDYFHPTLNGAPHFHKPLLSYWAIVGASALVGGLGELAARLPSALAGLIALGATIRLGRDSWSPRVGRMAGWILLGTYGFVFWSRTAAADMENLAAVILAVAWFRCGEHRASLFFYVVFGLICAVGAHAKGLAPIALPLLVLIPHLARHGRFREHARPAVLAVAGLTAVVVYLAPFAWAEVIRAPAGGVVDSALSGDPRSGLYMVFHENVRRFFAPHDHRGPVHTYLLALPVLVLPWTLVFASSLVGALRNRSRLDPETRWVLVSIALIFAFFTASGSRRSYYILPILPFCALFVSAAIEEGGSARRFVEPALRWTSLGLVVGMVAAAGAAGLAPLFGWGFGLSVPAGLAVVTIGLAAVACAAWSRRHVLAPWIAARLDVPVAASLPIVFSVLVLGGYFGLQYPILDRFRTEKPFSLELRDAASGLAARRVAFVRHAPSLFAFYMDASGPLSVLRTPEEVREFAAGGAGLVVASPRSLSRLEGGAPPSLSRPPDLQEGLYPWDQEDERLGAWWVGEDPAHRSRGD